MKLFDKLFDRLNVASPHPTTKAMPDIQASPYVLA